MNESQEKEYLAHKTKSERAKFLLNLGVTAKLDIKNLDFIFRAYAGEFSLPITAETEAKAVQAGKEWLESMVGSDG